MNNKAFTLIEVVTIVVILVFLIGVAIVYVLDRDEINRQELKKTQINVENAKAVFELNFVTTNSFESSSTNLANKNFSEVENGIAVFDLLINNLIKENQPEESTFSSAAQIGRIRSGLEDVYNNIYKTNISINNFDPANEANSTFNINQNNKKIITINLSLAATRSLKFNIILGVDEDLKTVWCGEYDNGEVSTGFYKTSYLQARTSYTEQAGKCISSTPVSTNFITEKIELFD